MGKTEKALTARARLSDFRDKVKNRQTHVAVIGLGYVGLPLAVEFARSGFPVTGVDISGDRVEAVNGGKSYIADVDDGEIGPLAGEGRLRATTEFGVLEAVDAAIICVPTPLRKTKDPDVSYIIAALKEIRRYLHPGMLVVLESTTYPGTTTEVLLPELESGGMKAGRDFFLAFSPERVDPGNSEFKTANTPKIVGGITRSCTQAAGTLYRAVVNKVEEVSSPQAAEMVKLLENTFRSVNIGLVNEISLICHRLGLDVWEIIDAAATKPFGFMPFYPGPGLGGHCIPVDPHYLTWKLRGLNFNARFIELASEVNARMPEVVVERIAEALNERKKALRGSRIHILGVSYKKDVGDTRESPALDVMEILHRKGAVLSYSDPFVPSLSLGSDLLTSREPKPALLRKMAAAVILAEHSAFDYRQIVASSRVVVDTRNATGKAGLKEPEKIVKI
jgi:UDP-N-acetyl-D-glucosamine dehydrogenase